MQNGDNEINKQGVETKEDQNSERKVGGWRDNKTTSRLQADLWLAVHTDKISTLWRRPHPQRTARERGEAQIVSVAQFITLLLSTQADRQYDAASTKGRKDRGQPTLKPDCSGNKDFTMKGTFYEALFKLVGQKSGIQNLVPPVCVRQDLSYFGFLNIKWLSRSKTQTN